MIEQGTNEWHEQRLGLITASRFADILKNGRAKGSPSLTLHTYARQLAAARLTGNRIPSASVAATRHGTKQEPKAIMAYEERTGAFVEPVGFVRHESLPYVGFSADGLIGDDGGLEAKSPFSPERHLLNLLERCVPREYIPQVQGSLWISGRKWWDFIGYNESFEPPLDLMVVRVERDEKMIALIEERCIYVESLVLQYIEQVQSGIDPLLVESVA